MLIHLHPSLVTRYALAVDPDAEAWEAKLRHRNVQHGSVYGDEVRVGFEPVFMFVKDIQVSLDFVLIAPQGSTSDRVS